MIDFGGSWNEQLPLVDFTYNNSYQASLEKAPFKVSYNTVCRSLTRWLEGGEPLLVGPELL